MQLWTESFEAYPHDLKVLTGFEQEVNFFVENAAQCSARNRLYIFLACVASMTSGGV